MVPEMRSFERLMELVHEVGKDGASGSGKEAAFNRVPRGVSEREGQVSQGPGDGKEAAMQGEQHMQNPWDGNELGLAEEWRGHCDQAAETSGRGGMGGSERGRLGRSCKAIYAR